MSGVMGLMLAGSAGQIVLVATAAGVEPDDNDDLTIAKPAGTVAGDYMVGCMFNRPGDTWTGASGWSERIDIGGGMGLRIATKLAGGAEPSSYAFVSGNQKTGAILTYRGGTFDVIGSAGSASAGDECEAPSVTLTNSGLLLAVFTSSQPGRTYTTPSGMIPLVAQSASAPSYAIFYQPVASGATGSRSSTPNGAGGSRGVLIGLRRK